MHVHLETSALQHRHRCNVAIERMQCDSPAVNAKRGGGGWNKAVRHVHPGLHAKSQMCGACRLSVCHEKAVKIWG